MVKMSELEDYELISSHGTPTFITIYGATIDEKNQKTGRKKSTTKDMKKITQKYG